MSLSKSSTNSLSRELESDSKAPDGINPFQPSLAVPHDKHRKRPRWLLRWTLVIVATVSGGAMNFCLWIAARQGFVSPRRWVFAPVVILGLQDLSDLLLGMIAGGLLYGMYAWIVGRPKTITLGVACGVLIALFHAFCITVVESRAPDYAF